MKISLADDNERTIEDSDHVDPSLVREDSRSTRHIHAEMSSQDLARLLVVETSDINAVNGKQTWTRNTPTAGQAPRVMDHEDDRATTACVLDILRKG